MIHLITLNPAIDNFIEVEQVEVSKTNYSDKQYLVFGGKACNVSKVLQELNTENTLITTTSEDSDTFINKELKELNKYLIDTNNIRINTKISVNSDITELNSKGERLSDEARSSFIYYVNDKIKENDHVLVAGNPHPEDFNFMIDLCLDIKDKTKYLYLDSSKITLDDLIKIKPYFIKPNDEELEFLINKNINKENLNKSCDDLLDYVDNIMVTLGAEGIYFTNKEISLRTKPLKGNVVNTVGAGDSCVAAVIHSVVNNKDYEDMIKLAVACGSATSFSKNLAKKEDIHELYNKVELD